MIGSRREQAAFEAFATSATPRLMRTAYFLCGDRGHAEDLVQATLLTTARRWHRARRQPEAYARKVLVNLTKNRWRTLHRRAPEVALGAEVVLPGEDPGDLVLERHRLMAAIRRLPAGQRAVLVLRFFDDLSVADTAAALNVSHGTVKSQTARALDRLRSALEHERTPADVDR
jgi:RNA polymerase sigma-70 factor (sigma-E family)